jgi:di/tricarboxylate transporter
VTHDLTVTLVILGVAVVLLVSDVVRADIVALLVAATLNLTGVLTPDQAFAGFGSRAVVTIVAVGILAEGLRLSGTADRVGSFVLRLSGSGEGKVITVWMLTGAFVSLFMNNIAAGAVLLPAASSAARRAGLAPSRVMMPLAFGTILGGMATLLTSANLIVSDLLVAGGYRGFGLLDFAPVGVPLVVAGTLYMVLWGRWRLPEGGPEVAVRMHLPDEPLRAIYRLGERTMRARVPAGSRLVGSTLAGSGIREEFGLWVTGVHRGGIARPTPAADFRLATGDVLELMGHLERPPAEVLATVLEPLPEDEGRWAADSPETVMIEAVMPPRSPLQGRTLREVRFADRFGMTVLAVWRGDRPIRTGVGDIPLQLGDALLLQGGGRDLERVRREDELIVLGGEAAEARPPAWKIAATVVTIVLALALSVRFPGSLGSILLVGALVMVLLGVLGMNRAYGAVEWGTVFLVAGMLPLGLALRESGAATLLAETITGVLGPFGPTALFAGTFLATALLNQAVAGPAVAAIMGPVGIQTALAAGLDPRAMGLAVAIACSMAFVTPLGHPVNVLMMGPGGYRFADYRRVGLPMALVLAVVVLFVLPLVLPLRG